MQHDVTRYVTSHPRRRDAPRRTVHALILYSFLEAYNGPRVTLHNATTCTFARTIIYFPLALPIFPSLFTIDSCRCAERERERERGGGEEVPENIETLIYDRQCTLIPCPSTCSSRDTLKRLIN